MGALGRLTTTVLAWAIDGAGSAGMSPAWEPKGRYRDDRRAREWNRPPGPDRRACDGDRLVLEDAGQVPTVLPLGDSAGSIATCSDEGLTGRVPPWIESHHSWCLSI